MQKPFLEPGSHEYRVQWDNNQNYVNPIPNIKSLFHRFHKNLPHPLQKRPQISRLIQSLQRSFRLPLLNFWPATRDPILPLLSIELEPRFALPLPFIHAIEDKFQSVRLSRPFNPHPQIGLPEIQFRYIEAGLRIKLTSVRGLC